MNFKKFEDDLYIHGKTAFQKIIAAYPNDHFYGFAFYTSGDYGYISPSASSYEGLNEAIQKYSQDSHYQNVEISQLERELKWSPCDSPIHQSQYCEIIDALQPDMEYISAEISKMPLTDHPWSRFNRYIAKIEKSFENALQRMDADGLFVNQVERDGIVLNLLMGDQDTDSMIKFARRVNPPKSIDMLVNDLNYPLIIVE